ncbi:MAG: hypothetical protein M2R45_00542 [Verrucomicrobia subdivision 3 bacterium]|nr:hypothetical protein [Limisphaerales bacterium]MCS1413580.1 hypothetical protein [Limisphaerales bacterium]
MCGMFQESVCKDPTSLPSINKSSVLSPSGSEDTEKLEHDPNGDAFDSDAEPPPKRIGGRCRIDKTWGTGVAEGY